MTCEVSVNIFRGDIEVPHDLTMISKVLSSDFIFFSMSVDS